VVPRKRLDPDIARRIVSAAMRRRTLLLAALLPAILIAAYSAYWFMLARTVVDDLANWTADRRAEGYIVSYGEPAVAGGFPLAVRVELRKPAITAPGGRWRWEGPDTLLEVWPWAPFDLVFTAPGHHQVDLADDRPQQLRLDAPTVELDVDLRTDGLASGLSLAVRQVVAAGSRLAETRIAAASAAARFLAAPAADPSHSSLDLTLDASGLDLPADVAAPLGRRLDRLHAVAEVMGPVPRGPPHEAIPAWRNAGGDIEIRKGELAWGPLELAAEGTLALDAAMQPEAAGTLHVAGLSEALDKLSAAGLIEEGPARLAKIMFGAFAKPPAGGGRPEVQLPLTIQDGHLYAGPIKLAHLHPVDWSWLP
jgi:hypothetical protein